MNDRERLRELHLALEGAVDQLAAAHRLMAGDADAQATWPKPIADRLDRLFAESVALRNEVRDRLLNALGRPT